MKKLLFLFTSLVLIFSTWMNVSFWANTATADKYYGLTKAVYASLLDGGVISQEEYSTLLDKAQVDIYAAGANPVSIYNNVLEFKKNKLIEFERNKYFLLVKGAYSWALNRGVVSQFEYTSLLDRAYADIYTANSNPEKIYNATLESIRAKIANYEKGIYYQLTKAVYYSLFERNFITDKEYLKLTQQAYTNINKSNSSPDIIYSDAMEYRQNLIQATLDKYYGMIKDLYFGMFQANIISESKYITLRKQAYSDLFESSLSPIQIYNNALEYKNITTAEYKKNRYSEKERTKYYGLIKAFYMNRYYSALCENECFASVRQGYYDIYKANLNPKTVYDLIISQFPSAN